VFPSYNEYNIGTLPLLKRGQRPIFIKTASQPSTNAPTARAARKPQVGGQNPKPLCLRGSPGNDNNRQPLKSIRKKCTASWPNAASKSRRKANRSPVSSKDSTTSSTFLIRGHVSFPAIFLPSLLEGFNPFDI
jgi:hypothetical protein